MKKYKVVNLDFESIKYNISKIMLMNYNTQRILKKNGFMPYYDGTIMYVDSYDDIICEFLLTDTNNIGFIVCDI
jgi:hypothetical protein